MNRVMVFVDGSNLYHALRTRFGRTDIDLGGLVQKLAAGRELIRTYYYNCIVPREVNTEQYARQQKFFCALRLIPDFEVRLGHLVNNGGVYVEKGVDVQIAVDMVSRAYKNQFDVAVLVSADADYERLVQEVKDCGKKVEVAHPGPCYALRSAADRFIELDDAFLQTCWIRATNG